MDLKLNRKRALVIGSTAGIALGVDTSVEELVEAFGGPIASGAGSDRGQAFAKVERKVTSLPGVHTSPPNGRARRAAPHCLSMLRGARCLRGRRP